MLDGVFESNKNPENLGLKYSSFYCTCQKTSSTDKKSAPAADNAGLSYCICIILHAGYPARLHNSNRFTGSTKTINQNKENKTFSDTGRNRQEVLKAFRSSIFLMLLKPKVKSLAGEGVKFYFLLAPQKKHAIIPALKGLDIPKLY